MHIFGDSDIPDAYEFPNRAGNGACESQSWYCRWLRSDGGMKLAASKIAPVGELINAIKLKM